MLQQDGSNVKTEIVDIYMDTITVKLSFGGDYWFLTGIYASPIYSQRQEQWHYLRTLQPDLNGLWFLVGDFNEIIHPSEQRGGHFNQTRADLLLRTMDDCNLLDVATTGGKFTWARNCAGQRRVAKRLDRGVANLNWRLAFPEAYVEILCKFHSDHNSLLLRTACRTPTIGPRQFRFEAAWITHLDNQNIVQQAWDAKRPCPIAALTQVRDDSITFNAGVFGSIRKRKAILEKRLKGVQLSLERVDSARMVYLEQELRLEYDRILCQEELHWYQRSREQWIQLGDKNTKFFHAQSIIRRKRNKIHGLQLPNGIWCTNDVTLREEARSYFQQLFCSNSPPITSNTLTENIDIPQLSREATYCLLEPVTRIEVTKALNQMHAHAYKAPGPDGFQGIFFKQYWHIVGDDVTRLVANAFTTDNFDPVIAETLIVLIPKVDCPKNFKEFRPISLCNTI